MSKADADILRRAWTYIVVNGFAIGRTGYRKPGDECASCALGGLAAAEGLNLDDSDDAGYPDDFTYIVDKVPASKWLVEAQGTKTESRLTQPHRTYPAECDTAWSIWRHNDSVVKTFARARDWFARAIILADLNGEAITNGADA